MIKLDEMHVAEINAITSRQETPWHGTMMPAPGADRRGRAFSVVRGETKLILSGGHYQWFLLLYIHFQRNFT